MTESTSIATTIVEAQGITRDFQAGSVIVHALRGIDLHIAAGEFVTLRGRSGSGKTTLLNILVGLDDATQGHVNILGRDLSQMNEAARAALRRENTGILFQNAHLFPALTAQENVEVALRLLGVPGSERIDRALEALELVGLGARIRHRAMELSGGEQQRVALARALVHRPHFVVADEPTGNLDSTTGQTIVRLLRAIVRQTGIGLLVATHDAVVMSAADRVLQIHDGMIVEQ
ncbi:MAG TPA: ABC transporter ATP-binding protein [Ktedonobacteraceae bacterium]|jgi:ABC-type lipoprotein export system ATPase subunit|nr:ABC transporter ATP-binding protein [Ktedonobacteraceae bacterium]